MAMTEKLLPCPFCGSTDVLPSGSMSRTEIWCKSCNTQGPSIWHGGPTDDRATLNRCEAEAIAAWNLRTPSVPSRIAELEEAVEQAFKDGVHYATIVNVKNDEEARDEAWHISRARATLTKAPS